MNDKVCAFCINFDNVDENAIKCVKNCDNSKIQNCASGKQSCLHFLFAVSPAISSDVLETLLKNENFNNDFSDLFSQMIKIYANSKFFKLRINVERKEIELFNTIARTSYGVFSIENITFFSDDKLSFSPSKDFFNVWNGVITEDSIVYISSSCINTDKDNIVKVKSYKTAALSMFSRHSQMLIDYDVVPMGAVEYVKSQ